MFHSGRTIDLIGGKAFWVAVSGPRSRAIPAMTVRMICLAGYVWCSSGALWFWTQSSIQARQQRSSLRGDQNRIRPFGEDPFDARNSANCLRCWSLVLLVLRLGSDEPASCDVLRSTGLSCIDLYHTFHDQRKSGGRCVAGNQRGRGATIAGITDNASGGGNSYSEAGNARSVDLPVWQTYGTRRTSGREPPSLLSLLTLLELKEQR